MTREEEIENKAIEHIKNCMELCNHYSIDESDLEDIFLEFVIKNIELGH